MALVTEQQKNEIWYHLARDGNVVVFVNDTLNPELSPQLVARELFDFLRPCGFKQESPQVAVLVNGSYLLVRKLVALPAKVAEIQFDMFKRSNTLVVHV